MTRTRTMTTYKDVFKCLLDAFETDGMRDYCADMIEKIPAYIFDMPSSTTGKYHNATQCQPHGQVYHVIMFGTIMNHLLRLKCVTEKFPDAERRDEMRCVPIFHDALKCGEKGSQYTVFEHPLLAGKWVRETKVEHDVSAEVKERIARMCESHSGEWTTSKRSTVVLPEPQTDEEKLCHICDILSSRNDIDMQPPEYLKAVFAELEAKKNGQANFLEEKKAQLIELAKQMIANGKDRDAIYAVIMEHNGGKKNPASIGDIETIDKILKGLAKL